MGEFINRLRLVAVVALCLTTLDVVAQGVGPFPGRAIDAKTMKIQNKAEELVEKGDFERAHLIYRNDLAPIGDKYAQYMVGYMYLTGNHVNEDPVLASAWYRLAAERSYKEFLNERDHLLGLFSDVDLVRSDSLYLQLRREYSDVVLLLDLVKADVDMLEARTGSRLSGGGGTVTIVDARSGSSISGDRLYGQVRRRMEARLRFMGTQLDMQRLETDPDDVDIDELEIIVSDFVDTITDRPARP